MMKIPSLNTHLKIKNRYHAGLKNWMVWSIASNEIIDLDKLIDKSIYSGGGTSDILNGINRLANKILDKTHVSWAEVEMAKIRIYQECNQNGKN